MKKKFMFSFVLFFLILFSSCFPYIYYNQEDVILKGIDIDQTLEIAVIELNEGGFDSVLTIWAIRDQVILPDEGKNISKIYLNYIDKVDSDFGVWHFAWAISNLYRNGNKDVKLALEMAYQDAKKRPDTLEQFNKIANEHVDGEKIYMGDAHGLGRAYARGHIVIPGNKKYIQSLEEFKKNKEKKKK